MKELEKVLKIYQELGYKQLAIEQVLRLIYKIQIDNRLKRKNKVYKSNVL
jgi:hypothetical protein